MRILVVTQYFAPEIGAAPVRLTALSDSLQSLGHEVTVLTSLPNYPTGHTFPGYRTRIAVTETRPSGVRVKRVWTFPAKGAGAARYVNYLSFVVMAPLRMWSFRRPDVIVVESPPLTKAVLGWFISRIRRAPFVLNIADLWPDSVVSLGLADESSAIVRAARRLEAWSYRKAALVSYATRGIGTTLEADKQVDRDRLVFLPNGADTDLFRPMDPDPETVADLDLSGRSVFLYAGTHVVAAGMDILVDAAILLRRRPSIVIVLVGDGPAKAPLIEKARRASLANMVFMDPVQPARVAELYAVSVAGLVTLSQNELFAGTRPAKMFPALACGKPVVYSGAGEGADLVSEHNMGIVVAPGSADELANAMERIVDHPVASAQQGRNGRRYVVDNLAWTAIAQAFIGKVERAL